MQLVFEQIRAGGDRNFGYLIGDRDAGRAVMIDPATAPAVAPNAIKGNRRWPCDWV